MGAKVTNTVGVAMWTFFILLTASYVHADEVNDATERAFGFGPGSGSGFGSGSGSGFGGGAFGGQNGFNGIAGFDIATASRYRSIHGILASLAVVVLFPVGSIFMRLIPGRLATWVHALTQIIGFIIFVVAAALGIHLVRTVQIPFGGGNLLTNEATKYHPIVGLVALATLGLQPVLGWIHHRQWKKLGRRTFWSHMHIWNGRFGITSAIINGGLGLQLANAPTNLKLAYTVVAAIMWVLWVVCAVVGEVRRRRGLVTPAVRGVRAAPPKVSTQSRDSHSRRSRGSRGSGSASDRV